MGDGQQPRLPMTMPAAIDGDGFETDIHRREMGAGGDTGLTEDSGCRFAFNSEIFCVVYR